MFVEFDAKENPDAALLRLLDYQVSCRGRVATAEVLGVNFRTLKNCLESGRLSRRMREALEEFGKSMPVGGDPPSAANKDSLGEPEHNPLALRVTDVEAENRELRGTVEAQAAHLEELGRRVAVLEEQRRRRGVPRWLGLAGRSQGRGATDWVTGPTEPRVVTPEYQSGEERALGLRLP